jgi:hypothetical protein
MSLAKASASLVERKPAWLEGRRLAALKLTGMSKTMAWAAINNV